MILFALYACKQSPADSETGVPQAPPECDAPITVPGLLGSIDPAPPDAHSEIFGPAPEPFAVRINWPDSDPSRSVAWLWRTDVDTTATVVEYGVGTELTERIEGASFRYGGTAAAPGPQRIHEVKICGTLEPDTLYSYRVGGEGHWSEVFTFRTPGEPDGFDTFRMAIAGDSRGAYETWAEILGAIDAYEPDLVVFSGDMVDFGANQAEWDSWFRAAGDRMARIPFVPAHGNHEFMTPHYFAQWSLPGNEQWYTVRYGPMQLAVLNDTVTDQSAIDAQAAFLDEVFAESTATWRVAMHHQSMYATCTTHGSNEVLRAAWAPKYDAHDLQLVLNGHNHIYERSVPIRNNQLAEPGEGTTYLVTGGAGADLYTGFAEQWFGLVANPTEHYAIADVGPEQIDVVVRDLAGNVIDEFVVLP